MHIKRYNPYYTYVLRILLWAPQVHYSVDDKVQFYDYPLPIVRETPETPPIGK